jgi:hypothetical protein
MKRSSGLHVHCEAHNDTNPKNNQQKYNNLFVTDSKAQVAREERRWNTYKLKLL